MLSKIKYLAAISSLLLSTPLIASAAEDPSTCERVIEIANELVGSGVFRRGAFVDPFNMGGADEESRSGCIERRELNGRIEVMVRLERDTTMAGYLNSQLPGFRRDEINELFHNEIYRKFLEVMGNDNPYNPRFELTHQLSWPRIASVANTVAYGNEAGGSNIISPRNYLSGISVTRLNPDSPYSDATQSVTLQYVIRLLIKRPLTTATPTATPTISATPTIIPTPTATEPQCLSEEAVKQKIDEQFVGTESLCSDGVIEKISNEIKEINKKACLKPRPKPYLPRGLDKVISEGITRTDGWPICNEKIYKAILLAGYSLIGNPSQRSTEADYLKDNQWQCYRIKDEMHPYRFGRGSEKEEVIVAVPANKQKPEQLFGVTWALYIVPEKYPERLRENNYVRSPIKMFSDLKNQADVPHIPGVVKRGKMNQDRYTKILKTIKERGEVKFGAFGAILVDGMIQTSERDLRLQDSFKNSLACIPPKEKVVRDNEECGDYIIEKNCIDELAKSSGLRKGMTRGKAITELNPLFMKKAMRAVDVAGFGRVPIEGLSHNREDAIIMLAIIGSESRFNPWILNPISPDMSYGFIQFNTLNMPERVRRVIQMFGTFDAVYYPASNLVLGKGIHDGRLKAFRKNPGKYDEDWRWSAWSRYGYISKKIKKRYNLPIAGRGQYKLYLPKARVEYREFLEWKRQNQGN